MSLNARTMMILCWSSGCWAFSFGLGSQVVTHYLKAQDIKDGVVGLTHACYYLGVALGSCAVPWMNRRFGPILCATLGMMLSGATLALFPWGEDIWLWYLLRLANGWASGMSLVPLETIVSRDSSPSTKTQNFAFYGVALTIGGAIGIALGLHFYRPGKTLAFYLGGSVPVLMSLLFYFTLRNYPHGKESKDERQPLAWVENFLSYGTAWCQGFLEGGMLAFLSLFLLARGFSSDEAGLFMSVTMIGVILFQVPVGWLADRCGRTPTLLGCYGMVAATLFLIPWLSSSGAIAVGLFCFGACSGAMYPLGLALLGDRVAQAGLARAYAWYLAVECIGSQFGAAAMGQARDSWGEDSMFVVGLTTVLLVITVWLVLQLLQRQKIAISVAAEHHNDRFAA